MKKAVIVISILALIFSLTIFYEFKMKNNEKEEQTANLLVCLNNCNDKICNDNCIEDSDEQIKAEIQENIKEILKNPEIESSSGGGGSSGSSGSSGSPSTPIDSISLCLSYQFPEDIETCIHEIYSRYVMTEMSISEVLCGDDETKFNINIKSPTVQLTGKNNIVMIGNYNQIVNLGEVEFNTIKEIRINYLEDKIYFRPNEMELFVINEDSDTIIARTSSLC